MRSEEVQRDAAPTSAQITAMQDALQDIARQMLTSEMELESEGDFEGAYDIMIGIARKALSVTSTNRSPLADPTGDKPSGDCPPASAAMGLVPVEPTPEMHDAGYAESLGPPEPMHPDLVLELEAWSRNLAGRPWSPWALETRIMLEKAAKAIRASAATL